MELYENLFWTADLGARSPRPVLRRKLPWNVGPVKVSPDASELAYSVAAGESSEVYISNLDGTESRRLLGAGYRIEQLNWSPDGRQIAMIAQADNAQLEPPRLFVTSSVEGSWHRLLEQFDCVSRAAWSRDSKALFVAANSGGMDSIWRFGLGDNSPTLIVRASALGLETSAGGRYLYLRQSPFNLVRFPIGGGTEDLVASGVLQFATGEEEVYFVRQDLKPPSAEGLNLYRLDPAVRVPRLVANLGFLPSSMQLSRDGQLLYMERREQPQKRIMVLQDLH
ncbi:MAG: hypothetical protein ABSG65_09775 [Bryobacteraceae bacterium]